MNQELRDRLAETIVVVAIIAAAWFLLAEPLHVSANDARRDLANVSAELDAAQASAELSPELAQRYGTRLNNLLDLAAPSAAISEHDRILSLTRGENLRIERIVPLSTPSLQNYGPFTSQQRRLQIQASGDFDAVLRFLSAIAEHAPMTVVDHLSLAPEDSASSTLRLSASVKIASIEHDPDLAEARP